MEWKDHYQPPNKSCWQGRPDAPPQSTFFQVVQFIELQNLSTASIPSNTNAFGILGFCCEEGIRRNHGRLGAKEGPYAIRSSLAKLPVQKSNFVCYDVGNIVCDHHDLEAAQLALAAAVKLLLDCQFIPIILGGGHELAWGNFQGIHRAFPEKQLGIVNFDAHFDMRPLIDNHLGSSGTPFLQIAQAHSAMQKRFDYNCIGIQQTGNIRQLFETAKQLHTNYLTAEDLYKNGLNDYLNFIERIIDQNDILYLSLCMDVFAAAYAPGVSAPQAFGLTPWAVLPLIREFAVSGKVVSYDIAEMSPAFDIDQRTAKLAASFIYEIIHHHKRKFNDSDSQFSS